MPTPSLLHPLQHTPPPMTLCPPLPPFLWQVLLFNLPGQAGTTWHPDSVLTNDYYAACTRALLHYLGPKGNGHFMGSSPTLPFYILGCGNGANIATCFAMR
jgi:hypothetical protein